MFLKEVSLCGFRNLNELTIPLDRGINVFYGENAQGKTNFLESIYLSAMGRSHRTRNDKELIHFTEKESHIRILLDKTGTPHRLDVHLKRDGKKGMAIDGIPIKKLSELYGMMYVVLFSPEDLSIIKESPSERRRFLDMELCQLSPVYFHDLQQYHRILKQRNALLREIQKKTAPSDTLFLWNEQLIAYGSRIIAQRQAFITRLDVLTAATLEALSGGKDKLIMQYKPSVTVSQFSEKLEKNTDRDIMTGSTQIGPHKDDMVFFTNEKDVRVFGSQGQQRSCALALKLSEVTLIQEETGELPILLLDDVFSELDTFRQGFLLDRIQNLQTILTCTGLDNGVFSVLEKFQRAGNGFYSVDAGDIEKMIPKDKNT